MSVVSDSAEARVQRLEIPDFSLVVLIGATGSGKSSFAAKHFKPTEVISSDYARGLVADDETDQSVTSDAFDLVRAIAEKRLKHRRLTVIDATNVRAADRKGWIELARRWHALPVAVIIDPGVRVCIERNRRRPDRDFGPQVVKRMADEIRRSQRGLQREGFRQVWNLSSEAEIDAAVVAPKPLWTDRRVDTGPFDIIGDIHGCADELQALLAKLGYEVAWSEDRGERVVSVAAPHGRKVVFVGDLVDRGPNSPDALRIAMSMVAAGSAYCVQGNHERKLGRWLEGRKVTIAHGLQQTIDQLEGETRGLREALPGFLDDLRSHYWLDGGRLAVAHAGLKEEMVGRGSGAVREFALYGETTGEIDEFGLPVRADWAAGYRGPTTIVYGHTPVPEAEWVNNTLCIDTGCVFGGKLTALRWPERELVDVPAAQSYAKPVRPLGGGVATSGLSMQQAHDDMLDLSLVSGKRIITTAAGRSLTILEEQSAAALEVMSRYAINPKWLIHLPPTMSPPATTTRDGLLEHPDEAFAYYRSEGVGEVVVEEKHMGSRALLVVCRDVDAARRRFGIATGETGAIFTRTGRTFLGDAALTETMLARVRGAMDATNFWARHDTTWALLDAEIMPWSAKAQSLIKDQYAATGAAAIAGLGSAKAALEQAARRDESLAGLLQRVGDRLARVEKYVEAYARYCWPVNAIDDYRIAPFHLLATEGAVHMDKDHVWQMSELARLAEPGDAVMVATSHRLVDLADQISVAAATEWWSALTAAGGEGMVVKPRQFIVRGRKGLVQPAVKCRGPEYLRIIYGPEYDAPEHLVRLRARGLGRKRSLAVREFLLGEEALVRFIAREPLARVHEAVFGVLALESEPVDPRL